MAKCWILNTRLVFKINLKNQICLTKKASALIRHDFNCYAGIVLRCPDFQDLRGLIKCL